MTNQEIDKIMAEKVMGWYESDDGEWLDVEANHAAWSNIAAAILDDPCNEIWNPSTNITHTFQADDKMAKKGLLLELRRKLIWGKFLFEAQYYNPKNFCWHDYNLNDNPATAICLAIIAVLKGEFLK